MKISSARYFSGCTTLAKCPDTNLPEFAFIGRSNVGKSSLINMLTLNGKLAMTSHQPGKTVLINHFLINDKWFLVDLPGYGYARRSKVEQSKFKKMIQEYIGGRTQMYNLFVLIDSNIPPQKIDIDFIQWLGEHEVPFNVVFTKVDKKGKVARQRNIESFKKKMLETWEILPTFFMSSSVEKSGRTELIDYISSILQNIDE